MIQPQIDFCCFRSVAINIALTHCYKLVSFLNVILNSYIRLFVTKADNIKLRQRQKE